jgi:hypothetical protein
VVVMVKAPAPRKERGPVAGKPTRAAAAKKDARPAAKAASTRKAAAGRAATPR